MLNIRNTLLSAVGLTALLFLVISSAEAGTISTPGSHEPDVSRVDGEQIMSFFVEVSVGGDEDVDTVIVSFGSGASVNMVCADGGSACDGDGAGPYEVADENKPAAKTLVTTVGPDSIDYRIDVTFTDSSTACWPAGCDGDPTHFHESSTLVNTVPVLTDNAAVSPVSGMPEDEYTLTITYTDDDNHPGTVTAQVCDTTPDDCESLDLSTVDTDFTDGAVYTVAFNTDLGGTLTVTVSASDNYDDAADNRVTTFDVSTSTPWLKNAAVSATDAGQDESIDFTVVYCVFDTSGQGTPDVKVTIGAAEHAMTPTGNSNSDCKNAVEYSVSEEVDWAAGAQTVTFKGSNDHASAADLSGPDITINDDPEISAGTAVKDGANFDFGVTVSDVNVGDTLTVYAIIEFDSLPERLMNCTEGDCTLTLAESAIINERGGLRTVTFRVDDTNGASIPGDFSNTIDVTKTSDFSLINPPSNGVFIPGQQSIYTFEIQNDGNSADTFAISASSLNGWYNSGSSDTAVTVGYGTTGTFDIAMDVPFVSEGVKDSWSVTVTAGNDDLVTDSDSGETTVDEVLSHTVSAESASGSGTPSTQLTYYFTIANTGNSAQTFAYTSSSTNGWTVAGSGTTSALDIGESETIEVTHTVKDTAKKDDTATVTFQSQGKSATTTTTALQTYGLTISKTSNAPASLKPGDSFDITYTITNTGNGADTVSVSFNAAWLSSSVGTSHNLASDATGQATATLTVPDMASSDSSSSISASVVGAGSSDSTASYPLAVSSSTRSVSLGSDTDKTSYTLNKGTTGSGSVTVQNTGVAATFVVTAMDEGLSFNVSEITLAASSSGQLYFAVHAAATGSLSFTVEDTIDQSSDTFTLSVVARVFSTDLSSWGLAECATSPSGHTVVCEYDSSGWDGSSYSKSGTFTTHMTVTDSNGQKGTHSFDTPVSNTAPVLSAPVVTDAEEGKAHTFTFSIPTDSDGTISHFVIDFGDGESVTFQGSDLEGLTTVTTKHTYATEAVGKITVTATAYDNSGESTVQTVAMNVNDRTVTLDGSSYTYNLIALLGFFLLGLTLAGTAFQMQRGEITGDEEMNERDRQRLESVERRMESLSEREELLEVSANDASRAATKLEEHISAFSGILVRAQEIAAEDKLKELEAADEARKEEEEQLELDLDDPDIEMVAERFHDALGKLVKAREDLTKIEVHLSQILKMERDEQLEKLTEMTESYETTKRKINALQSSKDARDAAAVENNIMNLLSAAASGGGSVGGAEDFGDFGDFGGDDDEEFEVEIYEDEDGSFYYIDPDTGEEVPCDEEGNAL